MTALPLLITNLGWEKFLEAQLEPEIDLNVAEIGITASTFVMAPTLTAIPAEVKRIDNLSGMVAGADTIHLTCTDASSDSYTVRGFGLFLADGTLFAVYGQNDPIVQKSAKATMLLSLDILMLPQLVSEITFGDSSFNYPPASETVKGVAEIATQEETDAGVDDTRFITPLKLAARLAALLAGVTTSLAAKADKVRTILGGGLVTGGGDLSANRTLTVTAANTAELLAGTEAGKALTPAAFATAARSLAQNGWARLYDGTMFQWGRFTAASNTNTAVSFPTSFPNACFAVTGGGGQSASIDNNSVEVLTSTITTAGFSVNNSCPASLGGSFIAVGN